MKLVLKKPDTYGAIASTLCMLHCFATPLLFIAHASSKNHNGMAPTWWRSLDYLFLIISFFAVYRSTKTTTKKMMKSALWISWVALFIVIMNEKLELLHLPEFVTYIIAAILIIVHLYNLNYCQCKNDKCCTKKVEV